MPTRPAITSDSASARSTTATAQLVAQLTARDWWLLEMLHTHRVLTTTQILRLAYTARRTANARLRRLHAYGVIGIFRPLQETGSAPAHLVLDTQGAALLAARRGTTIRELPWRAVGIPRIAHSAHLAHTVGTNEVMVRLAAEHRTRPDRELLLWLPASVCAHLWGDWIHPDAYGLHHDTTPRDPTREHHPGTRATPAPRPGPAAAGAVPEVPQPCGLHPAGRVTGFFLEYDRGTEHALRVAAKLHGYAAHAAGTRTRTPLLIHTLTATREQLLRTRLADTAADLDLPVATTCTALTPAEQPLHLNRFDHDTRPTAADPVWLPLTPRTTGSRIRLAELADFLGPFTPALDPTTADADGYETALEWTAVPPLPPAPNGRSAR